MFESNIIPAECAYRIRKRFIDLYVDTSHKNYVQWIKTMKATDVVYGYDIRFSFLWDCLKKESYRREEFHKAVDILRRLDDRQVFVMWDIRPKEHIYPDSCPTLPYPYTKYFLSDTILKMEANKVTEILLHDLGRHPNEQYWGEDVYVMDESLDWYIAFTHNEITSGKILCYIGLGAFEIDGKASE
ncbi:MAG: hypothetical protein IJA55_08530 [Clostridia bacterium]|nr:hypothetical protein [Clostridia bacterium]